MTQHILSCSTSSSPNKKGHLGKAATSWMSKMYRGHEYCRGAGWHDLQRTAGWLQHFGSWYLVSHLTPETFGIIWIHLVLSFGSGLECSEFLCGWPLALKLFGCGMVLKLWISFGSRHLWPLMAFSSWLIQGWQRWWPQGTELQTVHLKFLHLPRWRCIIPRQAAANSQSWCNMLL